MAGQQRARSLGKHVGRPFVKVPAGLVDLEGMVSLYGSIRAAAKALKVSATTLRRRLTKPEVGSKNV